MARIRIVPPARPLICPACQSVIPWHRVRARTIACLHCGTHLQFRKSYFGALYWLALAIALMTVFRLGIYSPIAIVLPLVLLIPTFYVMLFITLRIFPPDLEPSDDYRAVLWGVPPPEADAEAGADSNSEKPEDVRPAGFRSATRPREHWTLEGTVIAIAGGLFAVFYTYLAAEPALQRIFPEIYATKKGPPGFQVVVYLGESGMRIDNGSTARWTCKVDLGAVKRHTAIVDVEWGSSATLEYVRFAPGAPNSTVRSAGLRQVNLSCSEPSGVTHSAKLN
jgi:hypothetical protein